MMKKYIILLFIFISVACNAQLQVGIYSSDLLLHETEQGKRILIEIKTVEQEWAGEYAHRFEHIKKRRESLNREWFSLKPEEIRIKQFEILDAAEELRRFTREKWGEEGEIHAVMEEHTGPFLEELDRVSKEFG